MRWVFKITVIEKLNEYVTTMVCVAVKGEPVIGIIHKPFLKETYWAWVDNGKSSNLMNTMVYISDFYITKV